MAPKLSDFFKDNKIDAVGWKNALDKTDNLADLLDTTTDAFDEVQENMEAYALLLSEIHGDGTKNAIRSAAKATGHFDEENNVVDIAHYKTKISDNRRGALESSAHLTTELLHGYGHSGWDIDTKDLSDEELETHVMTLAKIIDNYHGKVDLGGGQKVAYSSLLQNTLDKNNPDTTFGQHHKLLQTYLEQSRDQVPNNIINSSASQKLQEFNTYDSFDKRVDTFKSAAQKLSIPLSEDTPDHVYARANPSELLQIYRASQQDNLADSIGKDSALKEYITLSDQKKAA